MFALYSASLKSLDRSLLPVNTVIASIGIYDRSTPLANSHAPLTLTTLHLDPHIPIPTIFQLYSGHYLAHACSFSLASIP
jgi:hypothetical protein